jgi:hypothetical protein
LISVRWHDDPFALSTNGFPYLSLVVDSTLEIIDTYQRKIIDLEHQILMKPKMAAVRQREFPFPSPSLRRSLIFDVSISDPSTFISLVHIISGDLILHKRTLSPIKTLIYSLRRYDVDRVVALYDANEQAGKKLEGYMTHKSRIYLADVHDHMEYILTSIEMYAGISENLINYSFNVSPSIPSLNFTRPVLTGGRYADVVAGDERGYENVDRYHRLVCSFDPTHRLLRSSPSSLPFWRSDQQ